MVVSCCWWSMLLDLFLNQWTARTGDPEAVEGEELRWHTWDRFVFVQEYGILGRIISETLCKTCFCYLCHLHVSNLLCFLNSKRLSSQIRPTLLVLQNLLLFCRNGQHFIAILEAGPQIPQGTLRAGSKGTYGVLMQYIAMLYSVETMPQQRKHRLHYICLYLFSWASLQLRPPASQQPQWQTPPPPPQYAPVFAPGFQAKYMKGDAKGKGWNNKGQAKGQRAKGQTWTNGGNTTWKGSNNRSVANGQYNGQHNAQHCRHNNRRPSTEWNHCKKWDDREDKGEWSGYWLSQWRRAEPPQQWKKDQKLCMATFIWFIFMAGTSVEACFSNIRIAAIGIESRGRGANRGCAMGKCWLNVLHLHS